MTLTDQVTGLHSPPGPFPNDDSSHDTTRPLCQPRVPEKRLKAGDTLLPDMLQPPELVNRPMLLVESWPISEAMGNHIPKS